MKKTALFSLLTVSALLLAAPALAHNSKPTEGGVSIKVAEGGVSA
ncbi:hypothetical protein P8832_09460 [Bacillus subtilis]|nr:MULTISPECIES: hypothetical protein [Bacillus subtilis group]COE16542.1 Uncharacterised protein [Streptococcus pneumoniae]SLC73033.1 Uncharacterised protein [Mycobacteroides abscessus subsp. massiliense]AEB61550.1 hypothetical protein LL3_p00004 [Bacillus amyloliquefaciens LL3]MEC0314329.1 hypothetical protein [Bacillus subtilis]MEC0363588.1 hypothetical protein [Bacillus subtilis]